MLKNDILIGNYEINYEIDSDDNNYEAPYYILNDYQHICLGKINKEKNYYWCNVYKVDHDKATQRIGVYEFPLSYPKDLDNDPDLCQIGFPYLFPSQNLKSMDKVQKIERVLSEEKESSSNYKENKATAWIEKFLESNEYKIIDNAGGGNCFMYTIVDAKIGDQDVQELRKMISSEITQAEFKEKRSLYEMMEKTISETKESIQKTADTKEKTQLKKELSYETSIFNYIKYMKNIKSLEQLKEFMNTSEWWIDESGIEILEKKLNVKFIIFDKQMFLDNDLDAVLVCKYGSIITPENTKSFHPDHYILISYENNNHYTLITYDKKPHLSFDEIPIQIKEMIVHKCMEGKNIYDLIPEFKALKTSKMSTRKSRVEISHQDLYNPDVILQFHIKAADKAPGKGPGEKMENTSIKKYARLASIKNWRHKLDNSYQHEFELDGHRWNSVTHYVEANRFKPYPDFYISFSLDSSSEWNKDPEDALKMSKNWKKMNSTFKPIQISTSVLHKALKEKFKDEKMEELLKETHDAKLVEYVKGDEPIEAIYLMELRKMIK
jgi:predicted NAD-dependent protein-ADP-ribosyltransferase YbiA (DUF1768 family)